MLGSWDVGIEEEKCRMEMVSDCWGRPEPNKDSVPMMMMGTTLIKFSLLSICGMA